MSHLTHTDRTTLMATSPTTSGLERRTFDSKEFDQYAVDPRDKFYDNQRGGQDEADLA